MCPASIVVEHATHNHKVNGSNPVTVNGRKKIANNSTESNTKVTLCIAKIHEHTSLLHHAFTNSLEIVLMICQKKFLFDVTNKFNRLERNTTGFI
jgi:hypothetical protein